jgi:alpha-beta hydrolase superfamily lysophospholipase
MMRGVTERPVGVAGPVPDVLGPDWVARTITLPPDAEGDVVATVVNRAAGPRHDRAVLFVHGFVDYFFQTEHAARWDEHGYDFYAVDLRKYGRSLLPHQTPNDIRDLRSYGADLAAALAVVRGEHPTGAPVVLLGSSMGGLITSLWVHAHPDAVDALVLNSPWLDLNEGWFQRTAITWAMEVVGAIAPRLPIGGLEPYYGRALHVATGGAWDFDLGWKPHEGFPARAGWFRAIRRGQARVKRGLDIPVPVLVCASARSGPNHRPSPALADADCVLDVEHMARYGPGLGRDVTLVRIDGGIHDLALSAPEPRAVYERAVFDWLDRALPS